VDQAQRLTAFLAVSSDPFRKRCSTVGGRSPASLDPVRVRDVGRVADTVGGSAHRLWADVLDGRSVARRMIRPGFPGPAEGYVDSDVAPSPSVSSLVVRTRVLERKEALCQ
jgi:hypothetical protein